MQCSVFIVVLPDKDRERDMVIVISNTGGMQLWGMHCLSLYLRIFWYSCK